MSFAFRVQKGAKTCYNGKRTVRRNGAQYPIIPPCGEKKRGPAAVEQKEFRSAGGVDYVLTRKRVKNLNLRLGPDGSVRVRT